MATAAASTTPTLLSPDGACSKFTEEQRAVIDCDGALIVVQAYAGAGKTTMLKGYAEARLASANRILYLCFNRSVQQSAESQIPVDCRTLDSLALEHANDCVPLARRRHRQIRELCVDAVRGELDEVTKTSSSSSSDAPEATAADASAIHRVLVAYCDNVSRRELDDEYAVELMRGMDRAPVASRRAATARAASLVWRRLCDGESAWTAHAIHRKRLLVDGPRSWSTRYDVVMVDECQDLSPLMLAVVLQFDGRKLFVGDRHQHIYSFLGTVDAFDTLEPIATHRFRLSISFRFGARIADVATRLARLDDARRRHRQQRHDADAAPLSGGSGRDDAVTFVGAPVSASSSSSSASSSSSSSSSASSSSSTLIDANAVYAVLCRKNVNVFLQAIQAARAEKRVYVYGKEALLARVRSLYDAYGTDRWTRTLMAARREGDRDTLQLMRYIEDHNDHVVQSFMALQRHAVERECDAQVVLSTVHRAKGGEWDLVKLHDDVFDGVVDATDGDGDDVRIAYVACTRAKLHLRLPQSANALLASGAPPSTAINRGDGDDVLKWRSRHERRGAAKRSAAATATKSQRGKRRATS